MKNKIMSHVVAGYPNEIQCIELLFGMQSAGVYAIEIQIPFSDPSADGPTIMQANDIALKNNMTIYRCFALIRTARKKGLTTPIYIMSYANKVFHFGLEAFCKEAARYQVTGLIIPDLPVGSSDYAALLNHSREYNVAIVPVLSPGVPAMRLSLYNLKSHDLVYVTSTRGTTGRKLVVNKELVTLCKKVHSNSTTQIALGFGIRTTFDVRQALKIADIAVVGTSVIEMIQTNGIDDTTRYIDSLVTDID